MRKVSPLALLLACIALGLTLVGCSSPGATTTPITAPSSGTGTSDGNSGTTIVEKGFAFNPASLEVKVGDTITFTNEDSAPHNVSIDGKTLGEQAAGASVTWTAEKAGTYPYSCVIHPSMTGQIIAK